ncbi:nuclear membrane fusion protein kar5 [Stemphylium lycopersici]|uniref:Nuclear membrane fusion protein kar5 n=1 Tax=Stemphylium lycopersici TaxID=183478 RepID=A0A364MZF3_STELY|nr:nuclear membrane fusion protein kar5 [Stemphylium lycopersici]
MVCQLRGLLHLGYSSFPLNQKVITQAVDFVVSMQTAPTCTRMAASHLMNECKLLEHAPDFAKARPEAYLDNIKTEYAAKLAVCELLIAQPVSPTAPAYCDILVPAAKHCAKGGSWWHARSEVVGDKQCYPKFNDYQYTQCLKSLQSTPQYWTSFSNARQNAVVICQASRDAIERENQLEIFKNLTQVLGGVTQNMQKTTEEYEFLIRDQRQYSEEARNSHQQLKKDIQTVQETAVATAEALNSKFQAFMDASISDLIAALASNQNKEISRVHERMQEFSRDSMVENSRLVKYFTSELEQYHDQALRSLQTNHEAQVDSYQVLSTYMGAAQDIVHRTNKVADRSLSKVASIAQYLDVFESQTEHIAEGFAFLSAIPALVTLLIRGFVGTLGILFILAILYKANVRVATYTAGASCSIFLFHTCGVFEWLGALPGHISNADSHSPLAFLAALFSWQKGAGIVVALWMAAYPICCINAYLGSCITSALRRMLGPLWVSEYRNDGGVGCLPSVEIPAPCYRKCDSVA